MLSKFFTQSTKQKSVWTKLWIILHCFHTKCIQFPKSISSFLIHTPPPEKLHIFTAHFSNVTHCFQMCQKLIQNRMMAKFMHFCRKPFFEKWRKSLQNIYIKNNNNTIKVIIIPFQLKAFPGVLFLSCYQTDKRGWLKDDFVWMDHGKQVGGDRRVTGEGEWTEDKGQEGWEWRERGRQE